MKNSSGARERLACFILTLTIMVAGQGLWAGDAWEQRDRQSTPAPSNRDMQLLTASSEGNTHVVLTLLDKGTNIEAKDEYGRSALVWALRTEHMDTAKVLIDKGADVNAEASLFGETPLIAAAEKGTTEIVDFLLAKGADVNYIGRPSRKFERLSMTKTALSIAAHAGKIRTAKVLIDKGADIDTAIELAAKYSGARWHEAVRILERLADERKGAASGGVPKQDLQRMMDEAAKKAAQVKQEESTPKAPAITSDVDKPRYRMPEDPRLFAVIVGIDKYSGSLPEARFAERDAQAVRAHLAALGYPPRNIKLLIGSEATRSGLVKNIESWLPRVVREDSTVFVYYSGHGAPEVKTGLAYLVPWDGDPEFLEDTAYSVKNLYQKLGTLKAKRVIVTLDSCFSGAGGRSVLAKGTRPLVIKSDTGPITSGKLVVLSASQSNQISGTLEEQGHGMFTYFMLNGLNGGAADGSGHVTVKGLYDYLVPKVQDEAGRHNRDQTPQLMPAGEKAEIRIR